MANDLRAQAALFGDDVPVDARSAPVAFASLGVGKASDLRAIVRGRNEDLKSLLEALAESLERLASGASDYEAGELRALRDYFADAGDLIVAALGKSPEMGNRDIENSLAW